MGGLHPDLVNAKKPQNVPSPASWFDTAARPGHRRHLVARLYAEHQAAVVAFAMHLGTQQADAEDVCSAVFEVALRRLDTFRHESTPRTWLFGIARRVLSDRRRSASARREVASESLPDQETEVTPESEFVANEERAHVVNCVQALPAPQRQVVVDFVLSERSMGETARRARVPVQTAYARFYAGRRQLATLLLASA